MKTMSRCLIMLMGCAMFHLQAPAQGFFVNHFDAVPVLSPTAAPDVWYTDRYAPAAFEQVVFDGQNRLRHAISFNDALANRPASYRSTFYNTQGRNFDVNNPTNTAVTADLYIGTDWNSKHRRADLWASFADAAATMDWAVLGFANTNGSNPTFRAWNSNDGTWTNCATPIEYGKWYTLKIELKGSTVNYYINGKLEYTYVSSLTVVSVKSLLLQAYNFADHTLVPADQYSEDSYDVYWDNAGAVTGIHNATQDTYSMTLPAAVATASNGDVIQLANGKYAITATLNLNHELTIAGDSEAGTIIDATATPAAAWSINPNKSNTTLSNLTILPNGTNGGYPIHVGDNMVPVVINNVTLSHITINGANKTAFDFNGVTNLNVSNLTATNTTHGNGIQFSGCTNVAASNLATSGNAWGGTAVYVSRPAPNGVGRGSDNVSIDAASSTFGESNKIYSQDEYGLVNTNISVPGFDFMIRNTSIAGYTFYQKDKASALAFAATLTPAANSVVTQISTGDIIVNSAYTFTNAEVDEPVTFDQAKTTLTFTSLPAGTNANITVTRSETQPINTPPPPANAGTIAPLYLDFSATGLLTPFSATITIDVSGIPDFSDGTIVMFYNSTAGTWMLLGSSGTYDPAAKTYTFTTDHFTTFSFVNSSDPLHLYLTADKGDVAKSMIYPHVGMGVNLTKAEDGFDWVPDVNDWTYKTPKVELFVVPSGSQSIIAANFKVKWDPAKLSGLVVTQGDMLSGPFRAQSGTGEVLINAASASLNVAPGGGKYIAKLTFTVLVPGKTEVTISDVDFRYYDNTMNEQQSVIVAPHSAIEKFYLGDFVKAAPNSSSVVGDGLIDFSDLSPFAAAYWLQQPSAGYLSKFDVGPTNVNGSYFAMPKPDGKIEFEDLVIFAIGYGKSASLELQKKQEVPAVFALGERELCGGEMRIPVSVSGGVRDLRALSLVLASSAKLLRVEKAGELDAPNGFVIAKQEKGNICIDAAMIGAGSPAISKEGVIAYVVLQGSGSVSLSEAKARDSRNGELAATAVKNGPGSIPESFSISQNYPNPFNPSTTFSFELPKEAMVQIMVFNSLGQEVAVLVNEVKGAGYYNVTWNAAGMPSGVYYYQVKAGDVNVTKKMLLMK